jgi:hypothetical protein
MNLTAYRADSYGTQVARDALVALRATDTTDVTVAFTWYVAGATGSTVAPDPAKTPADDTILAILRYARSLGLRTTVKPLVDSTDGTFRGDLRPADRAAFYASYAQLLDDAASLATQGGASGLVVGTELRSLSGDTAEWRQLIARARGAFSGRLTYGANWVDEAEHIGFWPALDEIGIDAYMPLSTAAVPDVDALIRAWAPYRDRIAKLHDATGKRVVFTELGYPSRQGALADPGVEHDGAVDQLVQARAYEAAFRAWRNVPWFGGIAWWDWSADGSNVLTGDGSYRPAGKQAEQVLRRYDAAAAP